MKYITPIKTEYNGTVFRSKLEAMWAVFFDALSVAYRYEPWADDVDIGPGYVSYKPDFYLSGIELWTEVKPVVFRQLSFGEIKKAEGWARAYGELLIISGLPVMPSQKTKAHFLLSHSESLDRFTLTEKLWWCACPKCGQVGLRPEGGIPESCERTCFKGQTYDMFGDEAPDISGHKTSRMKTAYRTARLYKF